MSSSKAVIIVTGASRGLGLAIVQKLLADGAYVGTLQRSTTPELSALESKYPEHLLNVQGSVTDPEANSKTVSLTLAKFGQLDSLVLNAGISVLGTYATTSLAEWHRQFDVNFFSNIIMLHTALPALRKSKLSGGAKVIFSSSVGSRLAPPGLSAYAATKAAVNSLALSIKNEETGIVAVALHPGLVATDMIRTLLSDGKETVPASTYGFFEAGINAEASGVTGHAASVPPEEPAKTFAWLALNAPEELNGKFYDYRADEVVKYIPA